MKRKIGTLFFTCILVSLVATTKAPAQGLLIPDGEITTAIGWDPDMPTVQMYEQTLISDSFCADFSGDWVEEISPVPGQDTCWNVYSDYAPQVYVDGGAWPVFEDQYGPDYVGWTPFGVQYYRLQRNSIGLGMPCGSLKYQDMHITDGPFSNGPVYTTNILTMEMDWVSVCASRAGVQQCRPW